jgi:tRNA(adenine34) deaminase
MPAERDTIFLRRCLELAQASLEAGETPVGSLIVRGDEILGEGIEGVRTLFDPSAHAEVQAIRAACRRQRSTDLSGCTLYTTVEPCVLCAYATRRSGVSRVVYGIPAGQAGGFTSRYAVLTDPDLAGWPPPPEIVAGVLAEECLAILRRKRLTRG